MNQQPLPATSTERVRAFRKRNTRIEYYPSTDAAAVIKRLRELNPALSLGQLLDFLIKKRRVDD